MSEEAIRKRALACDGRARGPDGGIMIPRCRDWGVLDFADRWVKPQRARCKGPCTPYPINMALSILNIFKPRAWLDPTAGWGERLIAAMWSPAYLRTYVGVDSNKAMTPAYQAMIRDLDVYARTKDTLQVHTGRLQDVLPRLRRKFDLVFTSPPFFTVDTYEDADAWPSVQAYIDTFLKPLVEWSTKRLEAGGHLVLYIEDRPEAPFLPAMFRIAKEAGLVRKPTIWYQGVQKPRPHFVFQKPRL
jgi:16S rRNA G966 N2-methylase RsmD